MVGKEVDTGTVDCRFPNVRKTYWRSATWGSHSAPPSPTIGPGFVEGNGFAAAPSDVNILPSTPRAQEQNQGSRSRPPLPPLQLLSISKKSLDEWPSAGLDDLGCDWQQVPSTPSGKKTKNNLDIKLDLASIQKYSLEPSEIQLKRNKFAHFDKQCSRVSDYHIYLGSDAVARDRETLRANGITHVLNCVGFVCPEYFKRELVYKTLWLQDSPCEDITSLLYDVFDYFEDVREQNGRVFVHCCQGVSRSTSLVIAYLMWRERSTFEDAFQDVKASRGITNPNMGFACQLLQCQKRVHATPMSPNAVLRMYRLAPHSPYDPLHLVPKALSNPGATCLDSRGAFVVHLPDRIFVWIGRDSDPKIAQAGKEAAGQVVRYERAKGPMQILLEGSECPQFWVLLRKCSLAHDQCNSSDGAPNILESNLHAGQQKNSKESEVEHVRLLGAGNRRVPLYDMDYDLYRTARLGGIIPPVPFTGMGVGDVPTRIPVKDDGWSLLRRKFLEGKLSLGKDTSSTEKSRSGRLLLDSSLFIRESPSLLSSTSSLSVTPESPFASPVSQLDDELPELLQSPSTPFATPVAQLENLTLQTPRTPYATPVPHLRMLSMEMAQASTSSIHMDSSPHLDHPLMDNLYISSSVKTTHKSIKSSASTLAQRRGGILPTLQLPRSENGPPPAPRGTSRKPKLPPVLSAERHKAEELSESIEILRLGSEVIFREGGHEGAECTSDTRFLEGDPGDENVCISELDTDNTIVHTKSLPKVLDYWQSSLYKWPDWKKVEMLDPNDLDTSSAFILLATKADMKEHNQREKVFVWIGKQYVVNPTSNSSTEDEMCHQIGYMFLRDMILPSDIPIQVIHEGKESEEFRDMFNKG
ncbi:hypothetical protein KP509_28G051400 [Ceratopteris richardii]|nr:hypothetical protein KP509_28G051400 [Ceratopteris richardii]KAH7293989.1 hypothetical protein KP509_28G051400 [Ceratopteris richardii]KAH7293990.1 hypothetical protein KP509_28G051400 [Ceratopteris richardii]KAH7293991.1 hypothetical protein KP509_28G051400 [Ceratopteris richardii]KAH7293992.1 hypothetical protein KP509_28G051400 [Ceratopteris richardii]